MNYSNDIIRCILLYSDIETIFNFYICCKNNNMRVDKNFWIQKFNIEKLLLEFSFDENTSFKIWVDEFRLMKTYQSEATKLIKVALYNEYINKYHSSGNVKICVKLKESVFDFAVKCNLLNKHEKEMFVTKFIIKKNFVKYKQLKLKFYHNKENKTWQYKLIYGYDQKNTKINTTYNIVLHIIVLALSVKKAEIIDFCSDSLIRETIENMNMNKSDDVVIRNSLTLYDVLDEEEKYYSHSLCFNFQAQIKNNTDETQVLTEQSSSTKSIKLETTESIKDIMREAAKIIKLPLYFGQYFERDENFDDIILFSIWLKGNVKYFLDQAIDLCRYPKIIDKAIKNNELEIVIHYDKIHKIWMLWCNASKQRPDRPNPWVVLYDEILYLMTLAIYLDNEIMLDISDYGYGCCSLIREVLWYSNHSREFERSGDYFALHNILDQEKEYYLH